MDRTALRQYVARSKSVLETSPQMDEETTKLRLTVPFIELLGWDTRSTEVEPEHTVQTATGKTKVDFALLLGDRPVVFIESKPARSDLAEDTVAELRGCMRQELAVDWGVVTNGRSFELLINADDSRDEKISLVQFELDELEERPEPLEILSKPSVRSGKSDEIAVQITQTEEAILHLQENEDRVLQELNGVLLDEIGRSVPLDTEAQATEFIGDLISALEQQRSAIVTASPPDGETELSAPAVEDIRDVSGEYVIKIHDGQTTVATFADDYQSGVMAEVVRHLVENYELLSRIGSIPYVPGEENAVINDHPAHPDERDMKTYRELPNGYYLFTDLSKENKIRCIRRCTEMCGLEVEFETGW